MVEGIGLINDVILTKLQAKMVPAKEKYGAIGTAICCAALAVAALFTKHYVYAVALAIGAYVFFSRFKGMTKKVHLANLAVAREKNQEIARFKVLFDEDDLIITTMDGEDPVEKEYRTFIKKIEFEEAIVLIAHGGEMVFISKEETEPEALRQIRDIIDDRCYNLGWRRKGDLL
jgi:hypothetical protein